jgi:elongation factor Ts
MAEIPAQRVAELRSRTGASMMDCKKALVATSGDLEKAVDHLRKQGVRAAEKKADRATNQGWIGHYIHQGRIGVLVEVACETDFVARNDKFQEFVRELAMHICSKSPLAVRADDLDPGLVNREREVYLGQVLDKPENVRAKIVEGKLKKFYSDHCLLDQEWFRDQTGTPRTVQQVLTEQIATIGENIVIQRFVRFELGQK